MWEEKCWVWMVKQTPPQDKIELGVRLHVGGFLSIHAERSSSSTQRLGIDLSRLFSKVSNATATSPSLR